MEPGQIIPEVLGTGTAAGAAFGDHRQYWMPWLSDVRAHPWQRPFLAIFGALILLHAVIPAAPSPSAPSCYSHDGVTWRCFDAGGQRM